MQFVYVQHLCTHLQLQQDFDIENVYCRHSRSWCEIHMAETCWIVIQFHSPWIYLRFHSGRGG